MNFIQPDAHVYIRRAFLVFLITFLLFSSKRIFSQSTHPIISSVEFNYKSVVSDKTIAVNTPTTAGGVNNEQKKYESQVVPDVSINLKTDYNVSKIFLKILDTDKKTILYHTEYALNSTLVSNEKGHVFFSKNNLNIRIKGTHAMPLKNYWLEIATEDNKGNLSPSYYVNKQ